MGSQRRRPTARRLSIALVTATAGLTLAACGGAQAVTDHEAATFKSKAQQQVPYMKRYGNVSDYKTLADSVCSSLDSGQSYGNVSDTVGATINKPASSGVVDDVIAVAIKTACPEEQGKG